MKCPGCGAEIGDSKVCEFCGTRISANLQVEEQKAQEQLNKQGCPKCGSTNIEFKRENMGEVRGKDHKRIVHTTVGYCKDCGYTWYPQGETVQVPTKRKTWLWVLGWICCFPIPLTILMLRKKDMKPILKYGIIALAWLIYIGIGMSGSGSESTEAPDTNAAGQIEVTMEAEVADGGSTPQFKITSNLPDETELLLTLEQGDYSAQSKVSLSGGEAISETFSNNGEDLSGDYTLRVTMPVANTQVDSVKEIIGEDAEKLSGPLVKDSEIEGLGNIVEAEFEFSF